MRSFMVQNVAQFRRARPGVLQWNCLPFRPASPHRLARPRTSPFHGGNGGSNPPGDAKST